MTEEANRSGQPEEQRPEGRPGEEVDEPGWEVDPEDERGVAVVAALGKQLRMRRKRAGFSAIQFGRAIGYGEDHVYKVEAGTRIPRPDYLDKADRVLKAQGLIIVMKEDVAQARYPKKVRELAKLESKAVELLSYGSHNLYGALQTEEYARALLKTWRPAYSPNQLERMLSARVARQSIFTRSPAPELSFVQEQVTLERPVGDRDVLRRQLQHLLVLTELPHVEIQVMPTDRANHPGTGGRIGVLKFPDGTAIGRSDGWANGRPVSDPKQLRILELRYGIIRAQALTPGESVAFIKQLLGET
ncbi:helix-turn-helix transcriptional regulator [Streptomyces sp. NPDC046887]|uniref:helix-turn-helix domain-containing protein n=1 Tax=Streptomyces sp. NPDC046887 TaxID=3155472 RepID=UPI0033FDE681